MHIMVLNDGETWTDLRGCVIMHVPDGLDGDTVEERIAANERILYIFDGDEDRAVATPVIPPELVAMDTYTLRCQAECVIGEDRLPRAALEELVAGWGDGVDGAT